MNVLYTFNLGRVQLIEFNRIKQSCYVAMITIFRVCLSGKMTPTYVLRLYKVWSIYYHGSMGRVHKELLLNAFMCFFSIFCCFLSKICVFIIFISFFDEVSNFRNRTLTNQKLKLAVSSCQWNCMFTLLTKAK